MKKYFKKVALLFMIITMGVAVNALPPTGIVTVGYDTLPEGGAALDIKTKARKVDPPTGNVADLENSDRGMAFPKVALVQYDSLHPIYTGVTTALQKEGATGMVVYNVNENAKGLKTGLVQWNGAKWGAITPGGSIAQFACVENTPVKLTGYYAKGSTLSPAANTMVVPITAMGDGLYTARAIVYEGNSNNEASFMFVGSGEFTGVTGTGNHIRYITLTGQGVPSKSTADNNGEPNKIKLYINGEEQTCFGKNNVPALPTIYVSEKAANFSYDCNSTKVFYSNSKSTIEKGVPLNANDNYVRILVRVTSTTPGAEFRIETDRVNGVKFTAEGILNAGANTITMEGEGTPLKSGTFNYTISGNNVNTTVTCSAEVDVMYTSDIKVLLWDSNEGAWALSASNAAIPMMVNVNNGAFLFDYGTNPAAPIHIKSGAIKLIHAYTNGSGSNVNSNNLTSFMDYHLVIISYNAAPSETQIDSLCNFVKAGRTCLFTADNGNSGTSRMNRIINKLSNLPLTNTYNSVAGTGDNRFLLIGGNLAVNGKYMDLSGYYIGRDGAGNFLFQNLPQDWIVLASNNTTNPRSDAKLIMHSRYRMFLSGDGGIFSGFVPGTYEVTGFHAARVTTAGVPTIPSSTHSPWNGTANPVHNAHFLANLMIWAFEAANE